MARSKFEIWKERFGLEYVRRLAEDGLPEEEIAIRSALTPSTFRRWKRQYPELLAALELGRSGADVNAHGDDIFHKTSVRKTRRKRLAVPPAWRLMKHLRCTNAKGDIKPPFAAIPHREA